MMNRRLSSGAGITLATIGIFSCSETITDASSISSDDLTADASRIASVSVSLGSSSIAVGDTTKVRATLLDDQNRLIYRTVTWSSSNSTVATVSATGLVTGVGAGTAVITASRAYKTGSATLTVTAATSTGTPVPVASVRVTLAASSVNVGGTTQAAASTYDSANNVLTGRMITWSSSNSAVATIAASGLVTALAAGSATITATSEGKVGSATLTVASAPPPPPPGTWRGNEPAGMTFIDERPFNSVTEGDSPHAPFWFMAGGSIVSDATAPQSPGNVIRATYPTGFIGGSASMQTGVEGQGISNRTFYITWWAKYSSNWFGHLTGVNKQCYFAANGSAGQAFFEANGVGINALRPVMVLQSGYATDATFYPNLVPGATVPRNKWFNVEIVLVGNTAGNSDGSFDWYIDGVHVGHASGLKITPTATGWDRFNFDPIWGGAGDIIPATQTLDLDHVYLSGKK